MKALLRIGRFVFVALVLCACPGPFAAVAADHNPAPAQRELYIGAPLAMGDSGLMDHLAQAYLQDTGITLRWSAASSARLAQAGMVCGVDAFFSDIPELEFSFMQNRYGEQWLVTLYSDFLLVGPRGNPANVPEEVPLVEALHFIATHGVRFASARDGSGNKEAEQHLWKVLKMPEVTLEPWYITGPQTPHTLLPLAAQQKAYAFVDTWSWQKYLSTLPARQQAPLEVIIPNSLMILKQYSLLVVAQNQCPKANVAAAHNFADWLVSPAGQISVGSFRFQGRVVFQPLDAPESRLR